MTPLLALTLAVTAAGPVLTLDEALAEAQAKNLDLRAARARLEQAEQASRKAWAGYLPTITANAAYTRYNTEARIDFPVGNVIRDVGAPTSEPGTLPGAPTNLQVVPEQVLDITIQPINAFNAQVDLRQALIVPTLWAAIKAATQAERLAELSTEAQRREILFAVAQAYYGAAASQAALTAQQRLLELNQAREKDTQARFTAGTVTRVAVLRTAGSHARRAGSLALTQRPVRREAGARHAAAEGSQLRAGTAARAPPALGTAGNGGDGARAAPGRGRRTPERGAGAHQPPWRVAQLPAHGGPGRDVPVEQRRRLHGAEAQRLSAEARTREEVARYQLELESALANRAKAQEAVELARESQRLTDISFRAGVATYLEVADTNTALTSAEVGFISERLSAALAALRLLKAVGAFPPPKMAAHERAPSSPASSPEAQPSP
jgi:outer membrane protein TolC